MIYWQQLADDDVGKKQDWIVMAAMEAGHEIPSDALSYAPELREDLNFYLVAYEELSTIRPASFGGILPLPYDKIDEYAQRHELSEDDREDFCEIIKGVDAEFRKFLNDESDKKLKEYDRTSNQSHDRSFDAGRRGKGRS